MISSITDPILTREVYLDRIPRKGKSIERRYSNNSSTTMNLLSWPPRVPPRSMVTSTRLKGSVAKNHIRENIRRVRQIQALRERNRSLSSENFSLTNHAKIGSIPDQPGPITAVSKSPVYIKEGLVKRYKCAESQVCIGDNRPVGKSHSDASKSLGSKDIDSAHTSVAHTIQEAGMQSLGKPTPHGIQGDERRHPEKRVQDSKSTNGSQDKALVQSSTNALDGKRYEYMRAHAKTATDEWNLKVLGTIPVKRMSFTPKPEQLTVPKASTAKSVQLIRRDINFVRANAHLAGQAKSAHYARLSVPCGKLPTSCCTEPSRPSTASNASVISGMWPQRRLPVGGIPHYLLRSRQKALEELERQKANPTDPDQPPGHQRMPENERVETLQLLRKAHKELTEEWSRLPLRSDTNWIINRRTELEQKLTELEQAIDIFNKPKVYIKPD